MRWSILATAVLSSALAAHSFADEVVFKNGDHITGKIETMEGGKMVITSKVAGKITVDMKDVKTFSSDGPIAIRLNDGTTVNQKVDAGPDGQFALAPGGNIAPQALPLTNIKNVNFKEEWNGNITAGGAIVRGNTESETLNLAAHITRRGEQDRITADAGYLYGRQRFITATGSKEAETANDWFIGGQYDYYFKDPKKLYVYANAKVERDIIAGISLRVTPGGGIGYDWFDEPAQHFHTEAGISWLYRDYTHGGGTQEAVALRLAYHYDRKLNDKVSIFHDFEYFPGLDSINDYYFTTDAGVRATLTEKMFAEFKIQEQYDQRAAPGKGHNDTQFLLSVGWNF